MDGTDLDASTEARQRHSVSALLMNHAIELHNSRLDAVAETTIRLAMALDRQARTLAQLGAFLTVAGRFDEAEKVLHEALEIDPGYHFAYDVLGYVHFGCGNLGNAISMLEHAVRLAPHVGTYKFDLACVQLADGDYHNGFIGYETRNRNAPWRNNPVPEWKGEPGRHVYVWWEQGAGDMFAMARLLPWIAERAARTTFAVPAYAHALFCGLEGICEVVPNNVEVDYDVQIPLMSVPRLMGLTLDNLPPPAGPFLRPAGTAGDFWPGDRKKVGLCWAGNKAQINDRRRSMPFTTMVRLAENPNLRLFSFQVGERGADISLNQAERLVENPAGHINGDWSATAAVLKQMDAVVTVCTGVAHLAASLGVPTYVCLHESPYWIWGRHRDTTPWYPCARLFRQDTPGDWNGVIDRVAEALAC